MYVKEFEYRYNRRKRPDAIFGDLVAACKTHRDLRAFRNPFKRRLLMCRLS